jgi:hypothetical protein
MGTTPITIHGSEALVSLKLPDAASQKRPLEVIMTEISRKARERGMTPEILRSILNEP